jgi:hypothetical protein
LNSAPQRSGMLAQTKSVQAIGLGWSRQHELTGWRERGGSHGGGVAGGDPLDVGGVNLVARIANAGRFGDRIDVPTDTLRADGVRDLCTDYVVPCGRGLPAPC